MISPTRLTRAVLIATWAGTSIGCVDIIATDLNHVEREEKRFTTNDRPSLDLRTFDGHIEVTTWDRPEVLVVVEKRGRDHEAVAAITVDSRQEGNDVTIAARREQWDEHSFSWNHGNASLIVTAPRNATIRAKSGDGSINVRDIHAEVSVQTGDGSIRINDVEGAVDAQSGDGSIRLSGTFTRVRARSGDGSVTVRADRGSSANDDWTITTGDGSVTLELPPDFSAELDAHTGDGRVRIDESDMAMLRRDGRNTVRGRLGQGGHDLRVRTGDGSIVLRQY